MSKLIIHFCGVLRSVCTSNIEDRGYGWRKFDDEKIYSWDFGTGAIFSGRAAALIKAGFFDDEALLPGQPGRKKVVERFAAHGADVPLFVERISRSGNIFSVRVEFSEAEVARRKTETARQEAQALENSMKEALNAPRVRMDHLTEREQEIVMWFRILDNEGRDMHYHLMRSQAKRALEEHHQHIATAKMLARPVLRLVRPAQPTQH